MVKSEKMTDIAPRFLHTETRTVSPGLPTRGKEVQPIRYSMTPEEVGSDKMVTITLTPEQNPQVYQLYLGVGQVGLSGTEGV